MTTLYEKALNEIGIDGIRWALVEEMGELMTAFSHERRGRINSGDVCKELVDVQMLINIIKLYYVLDCDWDKYTKIAEKKLGNSLQLR